MAPTELLVPAVLLGFANHAYFKHHEANNAHTPLFFLIAQPVVLTYLIYGSLSFSSVLLITITFIGTLSTSIIAYRLSPWHPLAHIPGPTLAKVSKWWGVKLALSGNRARFLKEQHDRYGDVVRMGPNEVSIVNADAVRSVLGTGGLQKGSYYEPFSDMTLPSKSIINLRGEMHDNRRRIWNRGMSSESLRGYEDFLAIRLQQLLDRLDEIAKSPKAELDISEWISYLTFDFMGDMAFGRGFNMLVDGCDKEGMWGIIRLGVKATSILAHVNWIAPTFNMIPGLNEVTDRLRRFGGQNAGHRIRSGPKETRDLWYHLMDEDDHEKVKPTLPEVLVDGVFTVVAGSDALSVALNAFMWCMLSHPDIYARVQAEVDSVYPDPQTLFDSEKHGELKLLTACFHESLRLYPPVPSGGSRQVPIGESRFIAGQVIPEHTQIFLPAYVIQRSPKHYFPAPDTFDPERWLRASSETGSDGSKEILNHNTFLAFSYGAANCAAKHLAWREIIMVACVLFRHFKFEFAKSGTPLQTTRWNESMGDYYLTESEKLLVHITKRE
ncbi:hypothetical protein MIND_00072400 [Mycena indigotica]|uniref:Cytochrome P450 n=1 Tax=Mycena indigotica TaxID=2126181 RepID=A0A8H6WG85_9AGAR|nr:uncharacterized protein MIND_00072400 [Mycena indigotica]KAF7315571.1 hypothetical protein MIND_00072400 [Mycena indigotica]